MPCRKGLRLTARVGWESKARTGCESCVRGQLQVRVVGGEIGMLL